MLNAKKGEGGDAQIELVAKSRLQKKKKSAVIPGLQLLRELRVREKKKWMQCKRRIKERIEGGQERRDGRRRRR